MKWNCKILLFLTLLPVFQKSLKAEFFYYAVPRKTPIVFLVSKISPDKELLSGYLNVYFGGRFIGKTFLKEKKPGEGFYLNLGGDRGIRLQREKVKDKKDERFLGGVERKTIIRRIKYKITVENLKEVPIKLKLLDNIPVSRTDKIVVKDININPEPQEENYQDKEGLLLWELELKAREKKEIFLEFTLTYPRDLPIYGL